MKRFFLTALAVILLAATASLDATQRVSAADERLDSTPPANGVVWNAAAARHLLSRTCFGAAPQRVERLVSMSLAEAVDALLDEAASAAPPARPEWVRDVWINAGRRWQDMSREEYLVVLRRNSARQAEELAQLRAWWLDAMITSHAPLREVLTLFWHGHFTSATQTVRVSQAHYQQNATLRKHALGNFRAFLEAITLDAAMMMYLDLDDSNRANPNENYARELFELFTLGEGNYTEKDVREAARALTGWRLEAPEGTVVVNRPTNPESARSVTRDGLVARFFPDKHDDGEKTILGKTGRLGMKDVLDLVVAQPACGRHVAGRLAAYFGAHDPKGALVDRMAKAFRDGGYEIRPMLRVLLTSPEFYADAARGNQVKSPVRLLVGACRDLELEVTATPALAQLTVPLGQELFNPPTVKGWPSGTNWISGSTMALRSRLGEALLDGKSPAAVEPLGRPRLTIVSDDPDKAKATIRRLLDIDAERAEVVGRDGLKVRFDPARFVPAKLHDDPERLADHALARMLATPARKALRTSLIEACRDVPAAERAKLAARLILASPEYQME